MPRTVRQLWEGTAGGFGESARTFRYEAYVPDPIGSIDPTLPLSAVEALAEAERAIADLGATPGLTGLEAMSRQLLRAESVASSRIEGLQLSHRRLAKATFDPAASDQTARGVIGNVLAMEKAIELGTTVDRLKGSDVLELHRLLFKGTEDESRAGHIRERQNWIGGSSVSPRRAEFIPPPAAEVPALLDDLTAFINRVDVPPVAQAAIVHAQFETIHPFWDGNGRVGRALIHVVLKRRDVARRFVPPISLVLVANPASYVEGLGMFRAGDLSGWTTRFAHALRDSTGLAMRLGAALTDLQSVWRERAGRPRRNSAAQRLIELLAERPIIDIPTAATLLDVSYPQAREAVLRLEQATVLRPVTIGRRRNRAWEAPSLLDLLDEFEFEAVRPTRSGEPRRASPAGPRAPRRAASTS
jgi:Fic family protein